MSDMKCPFCQQPIMCMDTQYVDKDSTWYCPRCIAEKSLYAFGNKTLWQELITTRKALDESEFCCTEWEKQALDYKSENIKLSTALDIAVDALKDMNEIIKNYEYGNGLYYALDGHDTMLVAEDVEKAICVINEIKGGKDA